MIHLYLKISEKLVRLILQDGFWFVLLPFVRMAKFKLLAQFPVDHLSYLIVSSFFFFLFFFCSFCVNLLHSFIIGFIVSSVSPYILHLLFYCVLNYFRFNIAGLHDIVQIFSCEISLVCRLKYPYSCFSSHFCFLDIIALLILVLFVLFLVAVIRLSLFFFI